MEIEEVTWCAGFFDGEGCIDLQHTRTGAWISHVNLVQRDETPLVVFEKAFGGSRSVTGPKKDAILLSFRKAEARHLLSTLLPYLVVKRRQAELILEYWQIVDNKPYGPWTGEPLARVELLAAEVKRLKRPWL
jgi:hypothetical protein